jgi:hypothetical protein
MVFAGRRRHRQPTLRQASRRTITPHGKLQKMIQVSGAAHPARSGFDRKLIQQPRAAMEKMLAETMPGSPSSFASVEWAGYPDGREWGGNLCQRWVKSSVIYIKSLSYSMKKI